MKIKVGILGATGYTGAELLRLLLNHPDVELCWLTSEKFAGKSISEVFPQFREFSHLKCVNIAKLENLERVDLAFSCLPHGTSMHFIEKLLLAGSRVIDFSADFRFRDRNVYERLYGVKHKCPGFLQDASYGLPEVYRDEIRRARLVANPGCYATSVILGLAPLYLDLADADSIIADSKSGISGAGRAPSLEHHFAESNESVSIYGVTGHNQGVEIERLLSGLTDTPVKITFIPHTVPIGRGILTTIYITLKKMKDRDDVWNLYEEYYHGQPFVRIYEKGLFPAVKNVRYSNFSDIGVGIQDRTLILVVALDNLGKGASGQAVQNMNIMFGLPDDEGLRYPGMYP